MSEINKIKEALLELSFIDEPELDTALLGMQTRESCLKNCEAGHCGGQTEDCNRQRMCDGKCMARGGCVKDSGKWCSEQGNECSDKGDCTNKCLGRSLEQIPH